MAIAIAIASHYTKSGSKWRRTFVRYTSTSCWLFALGTQVLHFHLHLSAWLVIICLLHWLTYRSGTYLARLATCNYVQRLRERVSGSCLLLLVQTWFCQLILIVRVDNDKWNKTAMTSSGSGNNSWSATTDVICYLQKITFYMRQVFMINSPAH